MSALLFCIAIGIITINAFENQSFGIPIGGRNWSDLGYADDLAVIAKSKAELKVMLTKLQEESRKFGLEINFLKTKIMPIGPNAATCQESSFNIQCPPVYPVSEGTGILCRINRSPVYPVFSSISEIFIRIIRFLSKFSPRPDFRE